jgi:sulfide:quinone oxidoreductase
MANILIAGGGFGGLITAKRLASSLGDGHTVTVVAPNRTFTFYPALVKLAFGENTVEEISFDLASALKDAGVRFIQGEVTEVHPMSHKVVIAGDELNGDLAYDYLVLAFGRRLALGQIPGISDHAHHILGSGAATRFGDAVREFRSGRIVLGSTPGSRLPVPVCETAFTLSRIFEDEIRSGEIKVSVIFPHSLEQAFGGAKLHRELEDGFAQRGIAVHYNIPITEVTGSEVLSSDKHRIAYDLLLLVPPFGGWTMMRDLGITDDEDFIKVDEKMRVEGSANVYAVGDCVSLPGPKLAHMAVNQAEVAAANIISEINGEAPTAEYEHDIAAIIDSGGPESIFIRYEAGKGADQSVRQGRFWSWAKETHDTFWRYRNR